ncbi:TRAP transporter substrate-binding protein DctP [Consotaella aegiceratis]|uniref:TRAP transporter substrate-binding protein DctP n=1 Tax=Consotaella aegiceratis TaxID=3097961 RepID=UPI002F3E3E56
MNLLRTVVAAASLAVAAPTVASAQTELIFNAYLPPFDEMYQSTIKGLAAAIEKESGGDITVTIPDSTLAPSDRQYEMVRDGIADMALVSSGAVPQLVTLNRIADLPFNSPSARAASIALWETYNKYFKEFDELKGVKVLSMHVLPGRQILSVSGVQVHNPSELEGVKLWSPPGALFETAEQMGAVPINTEFTDLQEYVTKGNVDAIIMTPGSANGARVLENVTSYTEIPGGLGSLSFAVFISQERWDELSKEDQQAIQRAVDGQPERSGASSDANEAKVDDIVAKITAIVPDGDDLQAFKDVLNQRVEAWKEKAAAKGLENPDEVLDFYRQELDRETQTAAD